MKYINFVVFVFLYSYGFESVNSSYFIPTCMTQSRNSKLCCTNIFGNGCKSTESWTEDWRQTYIRQTRGQSSIAAKFQEIRECFSDFSKCGFENWKMPLEEFIDNSEEMIKDFILFSIKLAGSIYPRILESHVFKLVFNIWCASILSLYLLTYAIHRPIREKIMNELVKNNQDRYILQTSLVIDGKTVTIVEKSECEK